MHIANILLIFSRMGIVDMDNTQVVSLVTEGIENFRLKIVPLRDLTDMDHAYGGFAYNEELPDFRTIRDKLAEVNRSNLNKRIADELNVLVSNLGTDTKTFVRKVLHVNGDGTYYGIPILSLIDVGKLFERLRQISLDDQRYVVYGFEERYGKKYSNSPFNREILSRCSQCRQAPRFVPNGNHQHSVRSAGPSNQTDSQ